MTSEYQRLYPPQDGGHDERKLVHAARRGDLASFETLVRLNERRIYSLARRLTGSEHDARDVTQQTFLSAVRNLGGFRATAKAAGISEANVKIRLLRARLRLRERLTRAFGDRDRHCSPVGHDHGPAIREKDNE